MEHIYETNDKVLVEIYDIDEKGYEKIHYLPAEIIQHVEDYGYNVRLAEPIELNIVSPPITPFLDSEVVENKLCNQIAVTYRDVRDGYILEALRNHWQKLTFRYITYNGECVTYTKGNMGDTFPEKIKMSNDNYINFSLLHCWFMTNTYDYNEPSGSYDMVVGIVREENGSKKVFEMWSVCSERLFFLWCLVCHKKHPSVNPRNPLRTMELYHDVYYGLAQYIMYKQPSVFLPPEFEGAFTESIVAHDG